MFGVITGSEERKEKLSEAVFGTMRSKHGADCHVATSPRHHVVTSPRKSASQHLMYERLGNKGIGKRTNRGTDFQSQRIQTSRECPGFVPLSILLDII